MYLTFLLLHGRLLTNFLGISNILGAVSIDRGGVLIIYPTTVTETKVNEST